MVKLEIELTPEQLEKVKEAYNLTEKPKSIYKGRPKPSFGDNYWFITSQGTVFDDTWDNNNIDDRRYAIGNVYCSEEEANFELEKKLITQELKDFALEHNDGKIDWENDKDKYCLYSELTNALCELYVGIAWQGKYGATIYFTSHEITQQAIDVIGKERLIKYYFGEWEQINERY